MKNETKPKIKEITADDMLFFITYVIAKYLNDNGIDDQEEPVELFDIIMETEWTGFDEEITDEFKSNLMYNILTWIEAIEKAKQDSPNRYYPN